MKKSNIFILAVTLSLMLLSTILFKNKNYQSISWTYPYFSGAANFQKLFDWQISKTDYENVNKLSHDEYYNYKHKKTDSLIKETVNNYGYVLIALTSMHLFPFTGDLNSAILLQIITHFIVCTWMIMAVFKDQVSKYLFLIFYAANPLIIHFVTFPFYYYWMFIPAITFIVMMVRPEWRLKTVLFSTPAILLSLLIRPTTLLLSVYLYLVAFYLDKCTKNRILYITLLSVLITGYFSLAVERQGSPVHLLYVGIGAYPNNAGVPTLEDYEGHRYFFKKTGISINTNAVHGNWGDDNIKSLYNKVIKERYLEIAEKTPGILLRNATLNMLESFSVGYDVDRPWVNTLSAITGFLVLLILIIEKQWIWLFSIALTSIGFTLYFPPIPAYNFASYPLLVTSFITIIIKHLKIKTVS